MSPDSFARLADAEPRLKTTFRQLANWAESHRDWKWLDPGVIAADIPKIDIFALAEALSEAAKRGYFTVKYTVVTPSGALAQSAYNSPAEIPAQLPDRFEEYFDTRNYPIVSVFERVESSSASARGSGGDVGGGKIGRTIGRAARH
jgi:hypothetical protein